MAEGRVDAGQVFDDFEERFGAKYPKAVACLSKDRDALLAFYDFPAEHWSHIRTTNVTPSSFATIRHRTRQAKGCVTRNTMLTMIYKMGLCAEDSWRKLRGFRHLAKVIEGVKLKDGIEVTIAITFQLETSNNADSGWILTRAPVVVTRIAGVKVKVGGI